MEFITFSDIHFYNNPSRSYIRSDGMNSWLYEQVEVVKRIFNYAKLNKIDLVIFNGDLFELRRIDFHTYTIAWNLMKEYSKSFEIIMNMGNHDYLMVDRKSSSLIPFSDGIQVIFKPTDIIRGNTCIRIIPHGMAVPTAKDPYNNLDIPESNCSQHLLFTHEIISGLNIGNMPFFYTLATTIKKEIFGDWDIIFNGHIHKPQIIKNIMNIGSCMIQDFGEEGEEKRFLHYKDGGVASVEIDCPKFITFDGLSDRIKDIINKDDRNFYRINVEGKFLGDEVFKKYNVVPNVVKSKGRKVRLKETKSEEEEIKEYINMTETKLNKDRLLKTGLSLL